MRHNRLEITLASAIVALVASVSAGSAYEVTIENNVTMKTRDGVVLRADVYRPDSAGRFPVILERTPYDKRAEVVLGLRAAARGYVFIVQDVRGRWASDGDWYPLMHESNDGYDCVEWAAALPYSNGRVGMWGGSYVGATQMLAAISSPPHLAGIMPLVTASNSHEHWVYQGGAFAQLLNQAWSTALAINTLERRAGRDAQPSHWDMKRPLAEYPMLEPGPAAGLADYYYEWLAHPDYDEYWKQWSIEEHFGQITVPALHIGAWYDIFQDGSVRNYTGAKSHGGSDAARKGQRLVMMVGGHAGAGPKVGDVDFGKDAVLDIWGLGFRWYDYLLKGIDNGMAAEKPVRIFVMGRNVWRDEDDWPLARAKDMRYFLHSGGKANSLAGDGTLSTIFPAVETEDRYEYDPADPVPTRGGPAFGDSHMTPGALDQRVVEKREDVLVYSTEAFNRDLEVTGPVTLELYASSSGVDTDLTGKLIDVSPDGFARNLTEGILRARYRNARERAELMSPGEIYRLRVELWSTSNVFLSGHRLRVEVSSSNFPRFDRNLNTGGEIRSSSTDAIRATNTVYHDRNHPSALIVPVVP